MTREAWQDRIVGDRMKVDQEFAARVREAGFTSQEWGLIMTAVSLEIEGTGESARIVADTTDIEHIVPELDRIRNQQAAMGGQGSGTSTNFIDTIKATLGFGGDTSDREKHRTAERLAAEYASALQTHLEETGRWSEVLDARD